MSTKGAIKQIHFALVMVRRGCWSKPEENALRREDIERVDSSCFSVVICSCQSVPLRLLVKGCVCEVNVYFNVNLSNTFLAINLSIEIYTEKECSSNWHWIGHVPNHCNCLLFRPASFNVIESHQIHWPRPPFCGQPLSWPIGLLELLLALQAKCVYDLALCI